MVQLHQPAWNLASLPGLPEELGWALVFSPLLVLKDGVPDKGLALLDQLCTKAARHNSCQIQALIGKEDV